jgi:hypothetical protein
METSINSRSRRTVGRGRNLALHAAYGTFLCRSPMHPALALPGTIRNHRGQVSLEGAGIVIALRLRRTVSSRG